MVKYICPSLLLLYAVGFGVAPKRTGFFELEVGFGTRVVNFFVVVLHCPASHTRSRTSLTTFTISTFDAGV